MANWLVWLHLDKVKPNLTTGRAAFNRRLRKWRFVSNWVCRIEAVRLTKVWVIYIPLPPSIVLIAKYRVVQVKSSHWSPVLWQSLKCCLGEVSLKQRNVQLKSVVNTIMLMYSILGTTIMQLKNTPSLLFSSFQYICQVGSRPLILVLWSLECLDDKSRQHRSSGFFTHSHSGHQLMNQDSNITAWKLFWHLSRII